MQVFIQPPPGNMSYIIQIIQIVFPERSRSCSEERSSVRFVFLLFFPVLGVFVVTSFLYCVGSPVCRISYRKNVACSTSDKIIFPDGGGEVPLLPPPPSCRESSVLGELCNVGYDIRRIHETVPLCSIVPCISVYISCIPGTW